MPRTNLDMHLTCCFFFSFLFGLGRSASFCGNTHVEPDEECDVGPEGQKGAHPCCDEHCRLRSNATCRLVCFKILSSKMTLSGTTFLSFSFTLKILISKNVATYCHILRQ